MLCTNKGRILACSRLRGLPTDACRGDQELPPRGSLPGKAPPAVLAEYALRMTCCLRFQERSGCDANSSNSSPLADEIDPPHCWRGRPADAHHIQRHHLCGVVFLIVVLKDFVDRYVAILPWLLQLPAASASRNQAVTRPTDSPADLSAVNASRTKASNLLPAILLHLFLVGAI